MPRRSRSLIDTEIAARQPPKDVDLTEYVVESTGRGKNRRPCIGCGEQTLAADQWCRLCVNEHNERELRLGGRESCYGIEREGWS